MSFAAYLVEQKILSRDDAARAEKHATAGQGGLVEACRQLFNTDAERLASAACGFFRLARVRDGDWPKSIDFARDLSFQYLRQHRILPLRLAGETLVVAITDPTHAGVIDEVQLATGRTLEARIATTEEIVAALERLQGGALQSGDATLEAALPLGEDVEHLKDLALGAPVVRVVNQILIDAMHLRATDIHIEPTRSGIMVRLRIDGMLREIRSPPPEMARAVVSRVKILSGLDIAERRLPQDGRSRLRVEGRQIDLRVATVPTINGEAVAIRLLENTRQSLDLDALGFAASQSAVLRKHLAAPYGLILVTGPTGSGKTTTLATGLKIVNETTRKILTIEDPVEYQIDGVNQIQVKPDIGLSFAHALRSFLRHDPDVMMVGELRDTETARIAVQAALTGHLVLSTLHTNSALGAVTRLLDMEVEPYLLASCLRCVIGQRLARRLCPHCRRAVEAPLNLPETVLAMTGHARHRPVAHWQAVGCDRCFSTGYLGRISLLEMLELNEDLSRLIKPGVVLSELAAVARGQGYQPMAVDGVAKSIAGLTTPDEVRRVALEA